MYEIRTYIHTLHLMGIKMETRLRSPQMICCQQMWMISRFYCFLYGLRVLLRNPIHQGRGWASKHPICQRVWGPQHGRGPWAMLLVWTPRYIHCTSSPARKYSPLCWARSCFKCRHKPFRNILLFPMQWWDPVCVDCHLFCECTEILLNHVFWLV